MSVNQLDEFNWFSLWRWVSFQTERASDAFVIHTHFIYTHSIRLPFFFLLLRSFCECDKFNHNRKIKWLFYFGHFVVCISNLLMVVAVGFYFVRCNLFLWQHRRCIVQLKYNSKNVCSLVPGAGPACLALPIPIHKVMCDSWSVGRAI